MQENEIKAEKNKIMIQNNMDENGYKLYSLIEINKAHLKNANDKLKIPKLISLLEFTNSNLLGAITYDLENGIMNWANGESELFLRLLNSEKIISFENINYERIIGYHTKGNYRNILDHSLKDCLIKQLELKTINLKTIFKINGIIKPQPISELIEINFDNELKKEILFHLPSIKENLNEVEKLKDWYYKTSDQSLRASNWVSSHYSPHLSKYNFEHQTKAIFYLYQKILDEGKLFVIEKRKMPNRNRESRIADIKIF
jgi:hypothetical protein